MTTHEPIPSTATNPTAFWWLDEFPRAPTVSVSTMVGVDASGGVEDHQSPEESWGLWIDESNPHDMNVW